MEQIFQFIGKSFIVIAVTLAGIFGGGENTANNNVGATIPIPIAVFETSLASSITSTATSMTLVSGTDSSGDSISGYICFNIDEGTSIEEFVCGTASGIAISSMVRGLDPVDGDLEVTALKKAHRRGASVKVTNYPSLGILSRILNGVETLPNPIEYASGVGPTDSSDLADKEYVLSVVSGGAVSFEDVIVSGNAGETVAAGNLMYLKSSDSEWYKTDADTASFVENVILGIAQGAGTDTNPITGGILIKGIDANQTGLTANTVYYASNTAGGLSSSAGTKEVTVGIATSTTSIFFAPRYNQQITEDEQDALAGTSGTPSSSNKFVTADGLTTYSLAITDPVSRVYTANDTWTKPANLEYIIVEVVGGGGGGGGTTSSNTGSGGGGGGGYSRELLAVASLGATEAITVGAAGTAGAGSGGAGGNGGTSSFGTVAFLQATGGTGGATGSSSSLGGAGGVGSSGTLNIEGQDGGAGGGNSGAPAISMGGAGGNSHYGGGGASTIVITNELAGVAGNNYGGGGGGSADVNGGDAAGGAGAAGVIIVWEYYY